MSGTDDTVRSNRGRLIFFFLIIIIGFIAIIYPSDTETMGIEERFSSALGISHEESGHEHGEGGGFALEGSPVLYAGVLLLFAILCYGIYLHFWKK